MAMLVHKATKKTKILKTEIMRMAPMLMFVNLWKGVGDRWNMVEGESSGAPGGGVAAVGADDVARFSLAEVGATCLNRCGVVSKEQSA